MSVTTRTPATHVAEAPAPSRLSLFWMSNVGKKILMALTGIILFLYVLVHMLGNLQIYLGSELINNWAKLLHYNAGFLWLARIVLLAAFLVHAVAGVQLWLRRSTTRPVAYRVKESLVATPASRTMIWTGLIIVAFVVYHVMDLTVGVPGVHPGAYVHLDAAGNLHNSFSLVGPVVLYAIAMLALGFHLWHGVYSMFGTLGLTHPRYTELVKKGAALLAVVIALGFASVPLAILTGVLPAPTAQASTHAAQGE